MEYLFIIGIIIIAVCVLQSHQLNASKSAIESKLKSAPDFMSSQHFVSVSGETGIAVDEASNRVCLVQQLQPPTQPDWGDKPKDLVAVKQIREKYGVGLVEAVEIYKGADPEAVKSGGAVGGKHRVRILGYKDLLSCEIITDGQTTTKTTRSGAIGMGLLGGVMFGGAGAIVGALSSDSSSVAENIVNQVNLKVIVNDTEQPAWMLNFLRKAAPKTSPEYQEAMRQAHHWSGLLAVLIKRADAEEQNSPALPEKIVSAFN